jgi:hypothetical protein
MGDKFRKSSTESMFGKQPGGKQHKMQITKTKKQKHFCKIFFPNFFHCFNRFFTQKILYLNIQTRYHKNPTV